MTQWRRSLRRRQKIGHHFYYIQNYERLNLQEYHY